jgi:hypothetical protein
MKNGSATLLNGFWSHVSKEVWTGIHNSTAMKKSSMEGTKQWWLEQFGVGILLQKTVFHDTHATSTTSLHYM